jgi:hypothetical protein
MLRGRKAFSALAATLVLAAASAVAGTSMSPRLAKSGAVYRLERGESAYCFDTAWRIETLWHRDASGAWQRVANPDRARLAELRGVFLLRMDVPSVGSIPVESGSEMKALTSLGYL